MSDLRDKLARIIDPVGFTQDTKDTSSRRVVRNLARSCALRTADRILAAFPILGMEREVTALRDARDYRKSIKALPPLPTTAGMLRDAHGRVNAAVNVLLDNLIFKDQTNETK